MLCCVAYCCVHLEVELEAEEVDDWLLEPAPGACYFVMFHCMLICKHCSAVRVLFVYCVAGLHFNPLVLACCCVRSACQLAGCGFWQVCWSGAAKFTCCAPSIANCTAGALSIGACSFFWTADDLLLLCMLLYLLQCLLQRRLARLCRVYQQAKWQQHRRRRQRSWNWKHCRQKWRCELQVHSAFEAVFTA